MDANHNLGYSPREPGYSQACLSVSWHLVHENTYKDKKRGTCEKGARDGTSLAA
jgi:hypothetical protein